MALKQFCNTLQQCAEKLEEEARYNINEFHNLIFGKNMDETKLALERAKDYHYYEIVSTVGEILNNIKKIIFHQKEIDWLSNEANSNDLKRFSYVKRQVYSLSNPKEKHPLTRSEENLTISSKIKRERRRTTSEISIGTLETWEKYLDQKEDDETKAKEHTVEEKKLVPKRTLSNARARKKFVSSTVGGFLDGGETRRNLDSIFERSSLNEESEEYDVPRNLIKDESNLNESKNELNENTDAESSCNNNTNKTLKGIAEPNDDLHENIVSRIRSNPTSESEESRMKDTHLISELNDRSLENYIIIKGPKVSEQADDKANSSTNNICIVEESVQGTDAIPQEKLSKYPKTQLTNLVVKINNSAVKEDYMIEEMLNNFLDVDGDSSDGRATEPQPVERAKPKIVDVIYKKKPS